MAARRRSSSSRASRKWKSRWTWRSTRRRASRLDPHLQISPGFFPERRVEDIGGAAAELDPRGERDGNGSEREPALHAERAHRRPQAVEVRADGHALVVE